MSHYTLRFPALTLAGLRTAYSSGKTVTEILAEVFRRIELRGEDHVWLHRPDRKSVV